MHSIFLIAKTISQFILIVLPLQLIGYVVVAIGLIPHIKDTRAGTIGLSSQRLHKWLKIWDNGDEGDIIYGLNGDLGYQVKFLSNRKVTKLRIFWMRYNWLALRNPVNHLKRRVLGIRRPEIAAIVKQFNDPEHKEIGDWTHAGLRYTLLQNVKTKQLYYELYWIKLLPKYLWLKGQPKCIRLRLGHKFGHNGIPENKPFTSFVCAFTPYKTYKGKIT